MRIALPTDIHGNLRALEAMLADPPRRSADLVVTLGDGLSGLLQPAAANALGADWALATGQLDPV